MLSFSLRTPSFSLRVRARTAGGAQGHDGLGRRDLVG
jgi:hypothetical protein